MGVRSSITIAAPSATPDCEKAERWPARVINLSGVFSNNELTFVPVAATSLCNRASEGETFPFSTFDTIPSEHPAFSATSLIRIPRVRRACRNFVPSCIMVFLISYPDSSVWSQLFTPANDFVSPPRERSRVRRHHACADYLHHTQYAISAGKKISYQECHLTSSFFHVGWCVSNNKIIKGGNADHVGYRPAVQRNQFR